MNLFRSILMFALAALTIAVCATSNQMMAQSEPSNPPVQSSQQNRRDEDTNLDTQLYLIVATNEELSDEKLPAALDPVLRQLRASMPFRNYRLSATLINRVKNDGRLNLKWIGGPLLGTTASTTQSPSFNEFRVSNIKLVKDSEGHALVRMEGFGFGARIPIQSGTAVAANGPAAPIINYESTGLNTDISMPEGEPVIVGTLNVGPSGDAIILVMAAKRTNR